MCNVHTYTYKNNVIPLVLLDKLKDTKDDDTHFVGLNVIFIWRIKMVFGFINSVHNLNSKNAIL